MYRRRRNTSLSSSRKVQFVEGGLRATGTSFKVPKREDAFQKGTAGSTKLVPLPNSPAAPTLDSPPLEPEKNEDISFPSISDRKNSLVSTPASWTPESRFSVSMPKEKKAELIWALKEQRQSLSTQVGVGSRQSLSIPQDRIDGSCSRETDDFVDNLTKQKMNLQLKSVTDRMSEVNVFVQYSVQNR